MSGRFGNLGGFIEIMFNSRGNSYIPGGGCCCNNSFGNIWGGNFGGMMPFANTYNPFGFNNFGYSNFGSMFMPQFGGSQFGGYGEFNNYGSEFGAYAQFGGSDYGCQRNNNGFGKLLGYLGVGLLGYGVGQSEGKTFGDKFSNFINTLLGNKTKKDSTDKDTNAAKNQTAENKEQKSKKTLAEVLADRKSSLKASLDQMAEIKEIENSHTEDYKKAKKALESGLSQKEILELKANTEESAKLDEELIELLKKAVKEAEDEIKANKETKLKEAEQINTKVIELQKSRKDLLEVTEGSLKLKKEIIAEAEAKLNAEKTKKISGNNEGASKQKITETEEEKKLKEDAKSKALMLIASDREKSTIYSTRPTQIPATVYDKTHMGTKGYQALDTVTTIENNDGSSVTYIDEDGDKKTGLNAEGWDRIVRLAADGSGTIEAKGLDINEKENSTITKKYDAAKNRLEETVKYNKTGIIEVYSEPNKNNGFNKKTVTNPDGKKEIYVLNKNENAWIKQ